MTQRLRETVVSLPPAAEWEQAVTTTLALEPGESAEFVRTLGELRLPHALVWDLIHMAAAAEWDTTDLLSYLVIQGAMRMVERGVNL